MNTSRCPLRWAVCVGALFLGGTSAPRPCPIDRFDLVRATWPMVLSADRDGDGQGDRVDVEPAPHSSAALQLVLSGSGRHESIALPTDAFTIVELDLDNDNDIDIVIVSRSGRWTALINEGNGVFWPKEMPARPHVAPVSTADAVTTAIATTTRLPAAKANVHISVCLDHGAMPARAHACATCDRCHAPPHLRGPPLLLA
jgi:hypothetical protein